jgi:CRISPR-associated protein Cmr4
MTESSHPFCKETYFAMALDPIHVGTGGYRLGRVDNTITREPGTHVPKIPGSSIAGVARAYTAMAVQSSSPEKMKFQEINGDGTVYSCAGKGARDGDGHCGKEDCEVCAAFGFSKKDSNSFQGLVQFFDARILFFPVYSMSGPVWITSPMVLASFGVPCSVEADTYIPVGAEAPETLNFGWLMLKKGGPLPSGLNILNHLELDSNDAFIVFKPLMENRLYILPDKLFSRVVNDNLEVRTSVAIDPATGAADPGALFTFESIPRATVLWFDVVYNDPKYFRIKGGTIRMEAGIDADIPWLKKNVKNGLAYMETLGVGGMNTRGMGRLKIFFPKEA